MLPPLPPDYRAAAEWFEARDADAAADDGQEGCLVGDDGDGGLVPVPGDRRHPASPCLQVIELLRKGLLLGVFVRLEQGSFVQVMG